MHIFAKKKVLQRLGNGTVYAVLMWSKQWTIKRQTHVKLPLTNNWNLLSFSWLAVGVWVGMAFSYILSAYSLYTEKTTSVSCKSNQIWLYLPLFWLYLPWTNFLSVQKRDIFNLISNNLKIIKSKNLCNMSDC